VLRVEDHPYWHVRSVISDSQSLIKSVELSYYTYVARSVFDDRQILSMSPTQFLDLDVIDGIFRHCPNGMEVALHSKLVTMSGDILHIPMIDMSTGSAAQLHKLEPIIGQRYFDFTWYKSGRSYHGYGKELINERAWCAFMGELLLANQIGRPHTVDPRWIGHRLISGYSALRWSRNTQQYLDFPRKLS
jgi:hypothetical protein